MSRNALFWTLAIGTLLLVVLVAWYWFASPPQLSKQAYELTQAMYRVCNQRDVRGLEEVERLMPGLPLNDPARRILQSAIARARAGKWEQSMQSCRRLLMQQITAPNPSAAPKAQNPKQSLPKQ